MCARVGEKHTGRTDKVLKTQGETICHSLLALENKQRRPVHRAGRNRIWCNCSPCKKQNYKHQSQKKIKKRHSITKAKRDIYNSEIYIISLKDNLILMTAERLKIVMKSVTSLGYF